MRTMGTTLAVLAIVGMTGRARAAEGRVLPPLTVTALDGTSVATSAVVKPGRWLLAYLRPQSAPSRSLLEALEKGRGSTPGTVAIVVGGDTAAAKALADEFPGLKQAAWYADVRGEAFRSLRLTGVPVVMGMQENGIEWSVLGIVPDRKTLPSVLASW